MKVELTAPTTQQDLAKVEEDMYLIPFIKQELKGFNLGESLAREDERHKIIELIKQKLQFCYSHKEIVKEILKSLSEDVEHD